MVKLSDQPCFTLPKSVQRQPVCLTPGHSLNIPSCGFHRWCGPCKQLTPRLETALQQFKDEVHLAKVDIDENDDLAMEYMVGLHRFLCVLSRGMQNDGGGEHFAGNGRHLDNLAVARTITELQVTMLPCLLWQIESHTNLCKLHTIIISNSIATVLQND